MEKGYFFNHWHGSTWSPWYGCLFGMFSYKKGLFSDRPEPRIFRMFVLIQLCSLKIFGAARHCKFTRCSALFSKLSMLYAISVNDRSNHLLNFSYQNFKNPIPSSDCTKWHLEALKSQKFPRGRPPDPLQEILGSISMHTSTAFCRLQLTYFKNFDNFVVVSFCHLQEKKLKNVLWTAPD